MNYYSKTLKIKQLGTVGSHSGQELQHPATVKIYIFQAT